MSRAEISTPHQAPAPSTPAESVAGDEPRRCARRGVLATTSAKQLAEKIRSGQAGPVVSLRQSLQNCRSADLELILSALLEDDGCVHMLSFGHNDALENSLSLASLLARALSRGFIWACDFGELRFRPDVIEQLLRDLEGDGHPSSNLAFVFIDYQCGVSKEQVARFKELTRDQRLRDKALPASSVDRTHAPWLDVGRNFGWIMRNENLTRCFWRPYQEPAFWRHAGFHCPPVKRPKNALKKWVNPEMQPLATAFHRGDLSADDTAKAFPSGGFGEEKSRALLRECLSKAPQLPVPVPEPPVRAKPPRQTQPKRLPKKIKRKQVAPTQIAAQGLRRGRPVKADRAVEVSVEPITLVQTKTMRRYLRIPDRHAARFRPRANVIFFSGGTGRRYVCRVGSAVRTMFISSGWAHLVQAEGLRVGDTIVFKQQRRSLVRGAACWSIDVVRSPMEQRHGEIAHNEGYACHRHGHGRAKHADTSIAELITRSALEDVWAPHMLERSTDDIALMQLAPNTVNSEGYACRRHGELVGPTQPRPLLRRSRTVRQMESIQGIETASASASSGTERLESEGPKGGLKRRRWSELHPRESLPQSQMPQPAKTSVEPQVGVEVADSNFTPSLHVAEVKLEVPLSPAPSTASSQLPRSGSLLKRRRAVDIAPGCNAATEKQEGTLEWCWDAF